MFSITISDVDFVAMDEQVFRKESVQRVYQYLKRMKAKQDLDGFKLQLPERPEGKEDECLDCLLEYVTVIIYLIFANMIQICFK